MYLPLSKVSVQLLVKVPQYIVIAQWDETSVLHIEAVKELYGDRKNIRHSRQHLRKHFKFKENKFTMDERRCCFPADVRGRPMALRWIRHCSLCHQLVLFSGGGRIPSSDCALVLHLDRVATQH